MAIVGAKHGVRARGGFNVEIKLDGGWFRLEMMMSHLNVDVRIAAMAAQRKFAEKYRDKVKTNIRTGGKRFAYQPLSKAYKKYKAKHGGPARRLFWSGAMEEAVEIVELSGGRVGVGIPKDAKRERYHPKDEGILKISDYANILEHGAYSRGVPARPIFKDTFKKDMKGMKGLKTFLVYRILRDLRLKGIPVSKI